MPTKRHLLIIPIYLGAFLQLAACTQQTFDDVAKQLSILNNSSSWSCDALASVPRASRCEFVRTQCESDSRVPYAVWYYCGASRHGGFVSFLYLVTLLLALPLLFTLLGDAAEMYFSPIMADISQTIPKMRPRFAGVTFVALGNGAPDLSSNISAIRNGNVLLSAGALTGAAMFVQCIVASEVIRVSEGVRCRGAMLRDISIYTISISTVFLFFAVGVVNRLFVALAVTLYCVYLVWVFSGDEWHARGRPRLSVAGSVARLRDIIRRRTGDQMVDEFEEGLLPWAEVDTDPVSPSYRPPLEPLSIAHPEDRVGDLNSFTLVGARTYRKAVWADLDGEDLDDGSSFSGEGPVSAANGYSGLPDYSPPSIVPAPHYQELTTPRTIASDASPTFPPGNFSLPPVSSLLASWAVIKDELTMGQASEWEDSGPIASTFRAVSFPILLPIYLGLRMTIPFVDPDSYNHQWLVVSALCSPLFIVMYLEAYTVEAVLCAAAAGCVLAAVVFRLTAYTRQLPPLMVGRFAVAPAVASLAGFVVGVMWIDTLANEVVGILTFLAGLCNFPAGVLGMTVLAWGNSLGDFFGNKAMARQGHASMALTACFASPLFNMLVSMSLGFGSRFAVKHQPWDRVQLTPEVALGCSFLIVYNVVVGLVGLWHRGHIPRTFFVFARVWYAVYFVLASLLGTLGHYGKL